MTMPKQLIEKRDEMARKHSDGLPSDMFSPSNQLIAYHKTIAGFDACYALMNEKLEAMREAVECAKEMADIEGFTCVQIEVALSELKKWREE